MVQSLDTIVILLLMIASTRLAYDSRAPLIGILMQPGDSDLKVQFPTPSEFYTYVPSSYVEWIAQTGAIPVLVPFDVPKERLDKILETVQGFLFPGGDSDFNFPGTVEPTQFYLTMKRIMDYSIDRFNKTGKKFPVFGTCQGFQAMLIYFADMKVLDGGMNDKRTDHPIVIDESEMQKSTFFSKISKQYRDYVFSHGFMYYSHNFGIYMDALATAPYNKLKDELLILGYSQLGQNHDGKKFLALAEHKKYPLYLVQFHPEKTQFERGQHYHFLDRSAPTMNFAIECANLFVDIAREDAKPYKSIPDWIKPHFSQYFTPINSFYVGFERVYLFPRMYSAVPSGLSQSHPIKYTDPMLGKSQQPETG